MDCHLTAVLLTVPRMRFCVRSVVLLLLVNIQRLARVGLFDRIEVLLKIEGRFVKISKGVREILILLLS